MNENKRNDPNYWNEVLRSILGKLTVLSHHLAENAKAAPEEETTGEHIPWYHDLSLLCYVMITNITYMAENCPDEILDNPVHIQGKLPNGLGDASIRNQLIQILNVFDFGASTTILNTSMDAIKYMKHRAILQLTGLMPEEEKEPELDMTCVYMVTQKMLSEKCRLATTVDHRKLYGKELLKIAKESEDPAYKDILKRRKEYQQKNTSFLEKYADKANARIVSCISPNSSDNNL